MRTSPMERKHPERPVGVWATVWGAPEVEAPAAPKAAKKAPAKKTAKKASK